MIIILKNGKKRENKIADKLVKKLKILYNLVGWFLCLHKNSEKKGTV